MAQRHSSAPEMVNSTCKGCVVMLAEMSIWRREKVVEKDGLSVDWPRD